MSDLDRDWIFDSVINFVKSPLWKVPITSFINEHCVIFDDEDENKLEYTDIHKKFKKLVEEMLTNMLNEIGISEETFAEACIKATSNPTHKMLLSEIMAVDNFLAFKKLMVKRNKDLSEEALQLMNAKEAGIDPNLIYQQQNYGGAFNEDAEIARAIQASLELEEAKKSGHKPTPAPEGDEDEMLRRVLEESKREYEALQAAHKASKAEEEEKKAPEPKKEKPKKVAKPAEEPKVEKPAEDLPPLKAPKDLAPIGGATIKPEVAAGFDIQKHAEETAKQQQKNEEEKQAALQKKTLTKEEMQERMTKLRQQRDLLLKKKQEALQKEWEDYGDKEGASGDSRKDMIKKGLEALQIKEGGILYQTEEQKKREIERQKEEKKKKEEEKKQER